VDQTMKNAKATKPSAVSTGARLFIRISSQGWGSHT
jgi:hypothetical protein